MRIRVLALCLSFLCVMVAATSRAATAVLANWVELGAVLQLPFLQSTAAPPQPFNGIQFTSIKHEYFEGELRIGQLHADGTFSPVESNVTFKFTSLNGVLAIFFSAMGRSLYVDERLRTFLIGDVIHDLRPVGFAYLTKVQDIIFLRTVMPPYEHFMRVNSGPLGQAVVHGYFVRLAEPLAIKDRPFSMMRFSDFTDLSRGTVEFGNVDKHGRWLPGGISTSWRYDRLGVTIGGRQGIPAYEIRNGTSEILRPRIPAYVMAFGTREQKYIPIIKKPAVMFLCMQLFQGR